MSTLRLLHTYAEYDEVLLAYSRNTHKELRIRRKFFSLSTIPDDFKGIVFRGTTKKNLQIYFLLILKKNIFCVHGEYANR